MPQSLLLSRHGHAFNPQRRRGHRAAKFQVTPNLTDVVEHLFEIAGNGNFFDGKSQFAVFDPQTAGAAREISGDQVYAKAQKFGDIKAIFNFANDGFWRFTAGLEKEISSSNSRGSRQPPRRISGRRQSQLARGV